MNIVEILKEKSSNGLVCFNFIKENLIQLSRCENTSFLIVNNKNVDVINFSTACFGNEENGFYYVEENDTILQLFESSEGVIIRLSAQGDFKAVDFFTVDIVQEMTEHSFRLLIAALNTSEKKWIDDFEFLKKGLNDDMTLNEYLDRYKSLELISVSFHPSIEDILNSLD